MIKEFSNIISEIINRNEFINWEGQAIDKTFLAIIDAVNILKKRKVVFVSHSIRYSWWKTFCKIIEEQSATGIIMVDHYSKDWMYPKGCVVVGLQTVIDRSLNEIFNCDCLPNIQTQRKADSLPYSFFLPVKSGDQSRALIQRHLSILGIAQRALMSTPNIPVDSLLLDDRDPWQVNTDLACAQTGKTFDSKELSQEKRFNVGGANVDAMITALQKCKFAIAMDNNPAWMDASAFMTEKMFWAFWAGVPVIWLCNPKKRSLLESWGFRDSSDGFKRLIHPDENPISGWISEIATLERLVTASVSQRWQDAQGERVYKNYQTVQTLRDRLHEHQWQEWQQIKDLI